MFRIKLMFQKTRKKSYRKSNRLKKKVKFQPYKPEPKTRNPSVGPKIKTK